jgi:hypothetical protein
MISFRKDTSFPYLKIARENGVPYAKVLRLAQRLKVSQLSEIDYLTDRWLIALIVRAMDAEQDRRKAAKEIA